MHFDMEGLDWEGDGGEEDEKGGGGMHGEEGVVGDALSC